MSTIHHIHAYDNIETDANIIPQPFSIKLCQLIGRGLIEFTQANKIIIGHSHNDLAPAIPAALINGVTEQGANIIDIGECNEELLCFAVRHFNAQAAVLIGNVNENDILALREFTFVDHQAKPITTTNGLHTIYSLAQQHAFNCASVPGNYQQQDIANQYLINILSILQCLSPVPLHQIKPSKVIFHSDNNVVNQQLNHLNALFATHRIGFELLDIPQCENSNDLTTAICQHQADIGVSFNRHNGCEIYDQFGQPLHYRQASQIIGQLFEDKYANATIVVDNINCYQQQNHTQAMHNQHAIQRTMANGNAIYGSTNNGTHFFQHLGFAPSQLLPWLLMLLAKERFNLGISDLAQFKAPQQNLSPRENTDEMAINA